MQCERSVRDPIRLAALTFDEPGGMAIRPGDGSRGSVVPYRTANQPTGGRQEKNGSVSYDLG
jgi:hypothetical protein